MSEYNKDLDVLIKDYGNIEGTELHVEVRSYDGGEAKISINRIVGKNKDKTRQVFRLPEAEALVISKFLIGTFAKPSGEPTKETSTETASGKKKGK
jgi:hypothetical protein